MKPVILLLTLFIHSALFSQITDSTVIVSEEDQILQQIQLDEPSEPIIRFGKEHINLLGKWCYAEIDSNSFVLSKTPDSLAQKNCREISFGYWGYVGEEMNRSFSVIDSVFQFHFFPEDQYFTKSYTIHQHAENQLVFTHLKTDPGIVPTDQPTKQLSISLIHQFKNKTADLSLDRIFRLTLDSVAYSGEVVELADCIITFHAYFVGQVSKDSIYRFPLDSITEIGYYYAEHYERYFAKHIRKQPKYIDEFEDFLRVTRYIGGASFIYTILSGIPVKSYEGSPAINKNADKVFIQIGICNLLVNACYFSFLAIRQFSTITYYDLEYHWQMVYY
ncbi:MAG: hypothetical protein V4604_00795 [Bacteroidota bacterium]